MAIDERTKKRSTAARLSPEEIQWHLDTLAFRKGLDAEDFVETAILWMKSQGRLQWYHRGRRWGEIDLLGMDFLISFHLPEIIPLQVKSSEFGKEEHVARYDNRIPCVVRYPLDTIQMMVGKILMASFPEFYEEGDNIETVQNFDTVPDSFEEMLVEALTVTLEEASMAI